MTRAAWVRRAVMAAVVMVGAGAVWALTQYTALGRASTWERQVSPGELSAAHHFLNDNCAACHTPGKGPDAAQCATCHANDQALLARQATAFHATVSSCRECHPEHRGTAPSPSQMDHAAFAHIGLRELKAEDRAAYDRLFGWVKVQGSDPAGIGPSPLEASLDCRGCHSTKDRHQGLFGTSCAECHVTDRWTVAGFRHPPPSSTDCAQCHQAPPSHFMMHFHMVSMRVSGQHHARVNQCYLCHLTTAWNDIRGVGWYKHH
nr:hypothetical protein [Gemmataceae bacterium]